MILAAFVTPALLYAGIGAVSIPILIHLLTRRRFRRLRWAAMEFLLDAQRRNRRRLRMEEWILLALRCLAILAIGLFIARPYLTPRGVAAGFGGSRRIERIFVLDDSFSMAYQPAGGQPTPFERAKLGVRRLVEAIRVESPEDTVTLLRSSAVGDPVVLRAYLDPQQTTDLFLRIEGLSPTQRSQHAAGIIEGIVKVLERSPDAAGAVVYFLSDLQRVDWLQDGSAGSTPSASIALSEGTGMFSPLVKWAEQERGLRIVFVHVGEDNPTNTAVTELRLASGQVVAGTPGRISASIANFSGRSLSGLSLETTVSSRPASAQIIGDVGARQTATVELEVPFNHAGFEPCRVQTPPDALPIDNVRHLAVEVVNAIRILVVNGEPAGDAYNNETTFLAAALRPEGEVFSGNELTTVDEAELASVRFSDYHLVVLANVYRLSDPVVAALEPFIRGGGGLLIFLGDQVDADLYNGALYREGQGVLPAKLGEIVRASPPSNLVVTDRLHPVLRGLAVEGDPLGLGDVPFLQYFACAPYAPSEGDDRVTRHSSRVLARFSDAEERPAFIEGYYGTGRVILVASSADKEWNLWPDHPTFLPVLIEMVQQLAKRGDSLAGVSVGSVVELPIDPALYESDAFVRTPGYPAEPEVSVTAAAAADGSGIRFTWAHTESAGVYRFVLRRREGGDATFLVAVNVDPRESDLTPVKEEELRRAFPNLMFEFIRGVDALTGGTGEARTELWRPVLIATLLLLMVEQGLAWFWGRRR